MIFNSFTVANDYNFGVRWPSGRGHRIFLATTGLETATDTVANAANFFSLATKNSSLVAKVAAKFLYDLDLN